jgi:alkylhydroperoxidase family enzyme
LVKAILDDWRTAPIDEKLRATLAFLEKLTLAPGDVGPDDVTALRVVGVSDQAIEDALYVCIIFNIIDRIADSLSFEIPSAKVFAEGAGFLLKYGYQ